MTLFFQAASAEHQKKEKAKARELRQSQWWRQQLGQSLCYHCKERFKPEELTMDHLIPIARGGKSNKNNCVPSCKDCNSKKGHKTTAELAFERIALEEADKRTLQNAGFLNESPTQKSAEDRSKERMKGSEDSSKNSSLDDSETDSND